MLVIKILFSKFSIDGSALRGKLGSSKIALFHRYGAGFPEGGLGRPTDRDQWSWVFLNGPKSTFRKAKL